LYGRHPYKTRAFSALGIPSVSPGVTAFVISLLLSVSRTVEAKIDKISMLFPDLRVCGVSPISNQRLQSLRGPDSALRVMLALQCEAHIDRGLDSYGLAVQQCGPVAPLANCIERGFAQFLVGRAHNF
jgi:hypothetical protein